MFKSVKRYEENHHDDFQHTEMTESSIKSNKITIITKFGYIRSPICVNPVDKEPYDGEIQQKFACAGVQTSPTHPIWQRATPVAYL